MSTATVILAVANVIQGVLLAWIAAWQQRAAHEVRALNGSVEHAIRVALAARASSSSPARGFPPGELDDVG